MPYQLEAGESISLGMRRLLQELVDQIVFDLTDPSISRDDGVHDARKSCKRVRAAYRLIRDEIGAETYYQENIRFRDTARLLAGARDSFVLNQTLNKLVNAHMDHLPIQAFSGIQQKLTEKYQTTLISELENREQISVILENMQEAKIQISQLPIVHEDFSAFRGGIRRVYRRGRRAMRLAKAQPSSLDFHEWRKRTKYLWHLFEILNAIWPEIITQLANELHLLSDYLGDDHDLAVLRETVLDMPTNFDDQNELLLLVRLIDQERFELEANALMLGERLFLDTPNKFIQRMETYWESWINEDPLYRSDLIQELKDRSRTYIRDDKNLLSTTELASRLEISPQKIRALIYDQKLPADKVGTIWVIRTNNLFNNLPDQDRVLTYPGNLLSTRDVASFLLISPENVRRLIHMGDLPAIKMGHQWVIQEIELHRFMKKNELS